jgi:hypothetical protein
MRANRLYVQLLPSIHHNSTYPLQVPGQHFLIAFLVPVMLGAALLLTIHYQQLLLLVVFLT